MERSQYNTLLTVQVIILILVSILLVHTLTVKSEAGFAGKNNNAYVDERTAHVDVDASDCYMFGDGAAPNYLVVYSRYNCSYCRYFYAHVMDSLAGYIRARQIAVICKDLADPADRLAMLMAKVAEVARQTKHFPELHRLLTTGAEPADSLQVIALAASAGIPEKELNDRLNAESTVARIRRDYLEAGRLHINATPSFVLNGQVHVGYMALADILSKAGIASNNNNSCITAE